MSQYQKEYRTFFESPAGISMLTWLQEQRTNEYDKAEKHPGDAGWHVSTAKAYSDTLEHVDSVMNIEMKSPYSSGESAGLNPANSAPSTGLGTSL